MTDYKEYAKQMRENATKNEQGNIVCSPELWEETANIIERAIVPLCKVGDTVYKITRNKVKKCEVVFIGISADEKCSYFNFVENYADGTFYKSYSMVFDVIGKTVFLTKEEAEKKLKELGKNGY